jgi:hypothetical protein
MLISLNQSYEDANKHRAWATRYLKKMTSHKHPGIPQQPKTMPRALKRLNTWSLTPFKAAMLRE